MGSDSDTSKPVFGNSNFLHKNKIFSLIICIKQKNFSGDGPGYFQVK